MPTKAMIEAAAEAIANARGMRRGIPSIEGILNALPPKIHDEVMEDAKAAMEAAEKVRPKCSEPSTMTFAWVIERDTSEPSRPEYFTGKTHPALAWSNPGDHSEAIRFARKVDAERMALFDSARKHRVCEHGWEE